MSKAQYVAKGINPSAQDWSILRHLHKIQTFSVKNHIVHKFDIKTVFFNHLLKKRLSPKYVAFTKRELESEKQHFDFNNINLSFQTAS